MYCNRVLNCYPSISYKIWQNFFINLNLAYSTENHHLPVQYRISCISICLLLAGLHDFLRLVYVNSPIIPGLRRHQTQNDDVGVTNAAPVGFPVSVLKTYRDTQEASGTHRNRCLPLIFRSADSLFLFHLYIFPFSHFCIIVVQNDIRVINYLRKTCSLVCKIVLLRTELAETFTCSTYTVLNLSVLFTVI